MIKRILRNDLSSVIIPLVILFIILVTTSSGFLSNYNITSLLEQITIFVLIGLAQMVVLSLGQFNLSLGSMGCLYAITMVFFMQVIGTPVIVAIFLGLLVAAVLGYIQGFLIAKSGINPFIITLSLISVYFGISAIITKGSPYDKLPKSILEINMIKWGPVPLPFLLSVLVCFAVYFIFRYMDIGKQLLATGESKRAALFSGIDVDKTIIIGHMISAVLCGIAAVIQIAKFGSAQISIGNDWMLTSFVVTVLGGTLLSGGKVSPIGTLLGAFEVDRARLKIISHQSDLVVHNAGEEV